MTSTRLEHRRRLRRLPAAEARQASGSRASAASATGSREEASRGLSSQELRGEKRERKSHAVLTVSCSAAEIVSSWPLPSAPAHWTASTASIGARPGMARSGPGSSSQRTKPRISSFLEQRAGHANGFATDVVETTETSALRARALGPVRPPDPRRRPSRTMDGFEVLRDAAAREGAHTPDRDPHRAGDRATRTVAGARGRRRRLPREAVPVRRTCSTAFGTGCSTTAGTRSRRRFYGSAT